MMLLGMLTLALAKFTEPQDTSEACLEAIAAIPEGQWLTDKGPEGRRAKVLAHLASTPASSRSVLATQRPTDENQAHRVAWALVYLLDLHARTAIARSVSDEDHPASAACQTRVPLGSTRDATPEEHARVTARRDIARDVASPETCERAHRLILDMWDLTEADIESNAGSLPLPVGDQALATWAESEALRLAGSGSCVPKSPQNAQPPLSGQ